MCWNWNCCRKLRELEQKKILASVHIPLGMRPEARGISHGLKGVHRQIFTSSCSAGLFDSVWHLLV